MILLAGKLCKTQTEIITRDARRFTRSNHTKSCRLPVPLFHKLGWQEIHIHTFNKKLLKNSAGPIISIGDSIATGLRRYQHIWKNYFKDALNLSTSGDHVENVLRRAEYFHAAHNIVVIIHCGTNNVDQIITGMLPMNKTYSFWQAKMNEANNILKAKCMILPQTYFINQDNDWVKGDLTLD